MFKNQIKLFKAVFSIYIPAWNESIRGFYTLIYTGLIFVFLVLWYYGRVNSLYFVVPLLIILYLWLRNLYYIIKAVKRNIWVYIIGIFELILVFTGVFTYALSFHGSKSALAPNIAGCFIIAFLLIGTYDFIRAFVSLVKKWTIQKLVYIMNLGASISLLLIFALSGAEQLFDSDNINTGLAKFGLMIIIFYAGIFLRVYNPQIKISNTANRILSGFALLFPNLFSIYGGLVTYIYPIIVFITILSIIGFGPIVKFFTIPLILFLWFWNIKDTKKAGTIAIFPTAILILGTIAGMIFLMLIFNESSLRDILWGSYYSNNLLLVILFIVGAILLWINLLLIGSNSFTKFYRALFSGLFFTTLIFMKNWDIIAPFYLLIEWSLLGILLFIYYLLKYALTKRPLWKFALGFIIAIIVTMIFQPATASFVYYLKYLTTRGCYFYGDLAMSPIELMYFKKERKRIDKQIAKHPNDIDSRIERLNLIQNRGLDYFPQFLGWSIDGNKAFWRQGDYTMPEGILLELNLETGIIDSLNIESNWGSLIGLKDDNLLVIDNKWNFVLIDDGKKKTIKKFATTGYEPQLIANNTGKKIFIQTSTEGIWEYEIEKQKLKKIFDTEPHLYYHISPTGDKYAYIKKDTLCVCDNKEKNVAICNSVKNFVWSNSGKTLTFVKETALDSIFCYQEDTVKAIPLKETLEPSYKIVYTDDVMCYIYSPDNLIRKSLGKPFDERIVIKDIKLEGISPYAKWCCGYILGGSLILRGLIGQENVYKFNPFAERIINEFAEIIKIDKQYIDTLVDFVYRNYRRFDKDHLSLIIRQYSEAQNIYKIKIAQARKIFAEDEKIAALKELKELYKHNPTAVQLIDEAIVAVIQSTLRNMTSIMEDYLKKKEYRKILEKLKHIEKHWDYFPNKDELLFYKCLAFHGKKELRAALMTAEKLVQEYAESPYVRDVLDTLKPYIGQSRLLVGAELYSNLLRMPRYPPPATQDWRDTLVWFCKRTEELYKNHSSFFTFKRRAKILKRILAIEYPFEPKSIKSKYPTDTLKIIEELRSIEKKLETAKRIDVINFKNERDFWINEYEKRIEIVNRWPELLSRVNALNYGYAPLTHYLKGESYLQLDEPEKAQNEFETILKEYPNSFFAEIVRNREKYEEMLKRTRIPRRG